MKNISIKALAAATVLMLIADVVLGIVLTMFMAPPISPGASHEQASAAINAMAYSTDYLVASMIGGLFTTVLGGYIVARMARPAPYLNACIFGGIGIGFGIAFASKLPLWYDVLAFAATMPAALLGAYIARDEAKPVDIT